MFGMKQVRNKQVGHLRGESFFSLFLFSFVFLPQGEISLFTLRFTVLNYVSNPGPRYFRPGFCAYREGRGGDGRDDDGGGQAQQRSCSLRQLRQEPHQACQVKIISSVDPS